MKNYQRAMNRSDMAKRIITSWVIVAVAGLLIGYILGSIITTHISHRNKGKEETPTTEQVTENDTEYTVYGFYDDRRFDQEISLDWGVDDLDFTPLDCSMPKEHQEFLFYLCAGYNLDFTLVMALIEQESTFRADIVSKSNDYGYMQINKINHQWLTETIGITDFLDPYQNMRAGCFILRQLFEKYQDADLVLMAYNMGENGASKLWQQNVFSTQYTEKIFRYQEAFNEQLGGGLNGKTVESD